MHQDPRQDPPRSTSRSTRIHFKMHQDPPRSTSRSTRIHVKIHQDPPQDQPSSTKIHQDPRQGPPRTTKINAIINPDHSVLAIQYGTYIPNASKMLPKALQEPPIWGLANLMLARLGAFGRHLGSYWRSLVTSCRQLVAKCRSDSPKRS